MKTACSTGGDKKEKKKTKKKKGTRYIFGSLTVLVFKTMVSTFENVLIFKTVR